MFESDFTTVYPYISIHPSNSKYVHVSHPAWLPCATSQGSGRPQPNAGPSPSSGMVQGQLLSFLPHVTLACRSDNTASTLHSVPCTSFSWHLISLIPEGVITFYCSSSPTIPSRDAPAGRPVDRHTAAADPSSLGRCRPHIPGFASISCLSSVHVPSDTESAALELPIWLFPSEQQCHP